jgi:hypothetical protein
MSKVKKSKVKTVEESKVIKPKETPTILALKRPDKPTEPIAVTNDASITSSLSEKPSIAASDLTETVKESNEQQDFDVINETINETIDYKSELIQLESIVNANNDTFIAGDKILVTSPWGKRVTAIITFLYLSSADTRWAKYKPIEPIKEGWSWNHGVIRAELLIRA